MKFAGGAKMEPKAGKGRAKVRTQLKSVTFRETH